MQRLKGVLCDLKGRVLDNWSDVHLSINIFILRGAEEVDCTNTGADLQTVSLVEDVILRFPPIHLSLRIRHRYEVEIKVGLTIFKARDVVIEIILLLRDYDRADGDLDECVLGEGHRGWIRRIIIKVDLNAAVEHVTGRGIRRNLVEDSSVLTASGVVIDDGDCSQIG